MKFMLVLLVVAVASATVVRYDGYQVYQIGPLKSDAEADIMRGLIDHDERLRQIVLLNDDFSKKISVPVAVAPGVVNRFLKIVNESSIPITVIDSNLQRSFEKTIAENERALRQNARTGQIFGHNAYLKYADQQQFIRNLALSSFLTASAISIGKSFEGRDITGLAINANKKLPSIYLDAGIHAREWISHATLLYIADKILTDSDPDAVYLRKNFRWYIIPNLNPDGYEYTRTTDRLWRKTRSPNNGSTCIGTDANRNWDANWGGSGASANPCDSTYRGDRAFSEAETRAARDFLISIRSSTNLFFSFHSYAQLWLMPWGGNATHSSDYDELLRVGNLAANALRAVNGSIYQVGTPPDILYVASGAAFDWVKQFNDVKYGYSPELRPTLDVSGGFDIPPSNIIPSGKEVFAAVVASAKAATHKL